MVLGRRSSKRQGEFGIAAAEIATGPRHVSSERLNAILAKAGFETWGEELRVSPDTDGVFPGGRDSRRAATWYFGHHSADSLSCGGRSPRSRRANL